jgi:hypothetical protein
VIDEGLDFLPSTFFSQETSIAQSNRKMNWESILKKELTSEKIASLCQIPNELVQ